MIKYIITLLFLLISAKASILTNDIYWFVIMLFIFGVGIYQSGYLKENFRVFGAFLSLYLVFVLFRNFMINHLAIDFLISDIIFAFKFIFLSFLLVSILKENTMYYIVKVMLYLTIISLIFFSFQILGYGDSIYNYSEKLGLSPTWALQGHTNFIIFSYTKVLHEFRNSGFVWEPGAFGCFLAITMLFNFFNNNFTFDKKTYIFIIAIITTFSTTAYIALLILLILTFRYKFPARYVSVIGVILTAIILTTTIPFLAEKIMTQSETDLVSLGDIETLSKYYDDMDDQIPLGRFASAEFLYGTFDTKLLLGVSNAYDDIVNNIYNVNISNGLFDFIAKFGIFGLLVIIYKYSKFCLLYLPKKEYIFYCISILFVLGFGEPVLHLPFFLTFLFLASYDKSKKNNESEENINVEMQDV
jgi:hypothetical protein